METENIKTNSQQDQARRWRMLRRVPAWPFAVVLAGLVIGLGSFELLLWMTLHPPFGPSMHDHIEITAPVCGTWDANADLQSGKALGGIDSISALSRDDVWAVGNETVWRATGGRWRAVAPPHLNGVGSYQLLGVDAASSSDVWIVGYTKATSDDRALTPLAWHWTGSAWSDTKLPQLDPSPDIDLAAVASSSASDVWAVGAAGLILHWDGSSWTRQPLNISDEKYINLQSVVAISQKDAWAVGYSHKDDGPFVAATLHWDGEKWSMVSTPAAAGVLLEAVAAIAPSDVWAVGSHWIDASTYATYETFTMHWDGAEWKRIPSPNVPSENYLYGIAALGPNDVWAVGNKDTLYSDGKMLVLHWDGAKWSVVPVPRPMNNQNLADVAAVGPGEIWTVGGAQYNEDGDYYSLAARFAERPCQK